MRDGLRVAGGARRRRRLYSADHRHHRPSRWASAGNRLGGVPIGGRAPRAVEISTRLGRRGLGGGGGGGGADDVDDDDIKTHLTTRRARSPRVFLHTVAHGLTKTLFTARSQYCCNTCAHVYGRVAVSVLKRAAATAASRTPPAHRPKKINPSRAPPPPSPSTHGYLAGGTAMVPLTYYDIRCSVPYSRTYPSAASAPQIFLTLIFITIIMVALPLLMYPNSALYSYNIIL